MTTAAAKAETGKQPDSMEAWEALWAKERDAIVAKAKAEGVGKAADGKSIKGPGGLTVERVGALESKDAMRVRVKWYVSLALFNQAKLARLVGVRP